MSDHTPIALEYTSQPADSRVELTQTGDALTLTMQARGTSAEFWGFLLMALPGTLVAYFPAFYFNWQARKRWGLVLPMPWLAFAGPLAFVVVLGFVLAWFIGGLRRTLVLSTDDVRLEVQGRFRKRAQTFPRGSVASIRTRSWTPLVELRDKAGRSLFSFPIHGRADRRWVANALRSHLGLSG
jgi:hypothetical protein